MMWAMRQAVVLKPEVLIITINDAVKLPGLCLKNLIREVTQIRYTNFLHFRIYILA